MKKVLLISMLGGMIEWAEYTFYAYLAVLFAHLFFPATHFQTALLSAFALFGAGYLMRPIGALFFSHIGDRYGRRVALSSSMALMGVATLSIGLLPVYATAGLWASGLLLLCRLLQGFAISGELNGIAIFLIEHDQYRRPYLMGSLTAVAAAIGTILGGAAAVFVLHREDLPNAWRIPFLIGAVGCFLGLSLRLSLPETPDFAKLINQSRVYRSPLSKLWREYKGAMIKTAVIAAFVAITFYLGNVYITTFLVQHGMSAQTAALIATGGQVLVAIFSPLAGWLADRWCGKTIILVGMGLMPLVGWLNYTWGQLNNPNLIMLAQFSYAISNALAVAPLFYWVLRLYPVELRYSGTTFPWGISAALVGGTAPLLAQFSLKQEWYSFPIIYIGITSLLGISMLLIHPRTESAAR